MRPHFIKEKTPIRIKIKNSPTIHQILCYCKKFMRHIIKNSVNFKFGVNC